MKAVLKTKKSTRSVSGFIAGLADPRQQRDCRTLAALMERATGAAPRLWGSIVGFKDVHLRYASGRELDWFALGFAPRKGNLSLYLCCSLMDPKVRALLSRLGPHSTGVGCLYLKSLDGVDMTALRSLITIAARTKATTPAPKRSSPRSAVRRSTGAAATARRKRSPAGAR